MENLICKNAGKSYKEKTVLKNVNLELEPGKIYGLIGRNGAGKTTLLSLMSAQNPVSEGEIFLGNEPVWENEKALTGMGTAGIWLCMIVFALLAAVAIWRIGCRQQVTQF
ncbi:MAG: ATP-binding cassette domain-containing protein [Lachnospira sp.]|nr:ATP-binding cassette domain-containing protein [Lachnospira sp.]